MDKPTFDRLKWIAWLATAALVAGCASGGASRPYATSDAPHAVLDFSPPPPGGDLTPARLFTVDGIVAPGGGTRTSYWLKPGTHRVAVYGEGLARDKVGIPARGKDDPGTVEMTLEAGRRYYVAIGWLSNQRNDWRPTIWKVE